MIYDILAQVAQGEDSRHQTHIVCEPVVLESLHVLSCHCMAVSQMVPRSYFAGVSYTVRHSLKIPNCL